MKLKNRLDNYLYDREYKITVKENYVDIVNYDEIVDFELTKISVRYKNKIIIIEGNNLTISKMIDNEVLVTGLVTSIRINNEC